MEKVEITKESFDNYYDEVNRDLHNGYSKGFVEYLNITFGDKWNFHLIFEKEKYYPFTILGTLSNIKNLGNLPRSNYYIKKRDGSYGRNIEITDNPKKFFNQYGLKENDYVIQKEINTDLNKNRKYDYRIYLLILKKNDRIIYGYYKKYVIRNSYSEYDDKNSIYSKITNHHIYSLQELDEHFYNLSEDFEKNHVDKIESLNKRVLEKIKEYESEFFSKLGNNQFRILGVDYLVEKLTNKLFILEINITPGVFYLNKTQDYFIKYNNFHKYIIDDLNNLILDNCNENWIILK